MNICQYTYVEMYYFLKWRFTNLCINEDAIFTENWNDVHVCIYVFENQMK